MGRMMTAKMSFANSSIELMVWYSYGSGRDMLPMPMFL